MWGVGYTVAHLLCSAPVAEQNVPEPVCWQVGIGLLRVCLRAMRSSHQAGMCGQASYTACSP